MTDTNFDQVLNAQFERQVVEKMAQWKVPGCAIALVPLGQDPILKTYHLEGYQPISLRVSLKSATLTTDPLPSLHPASPG